ncbi:MAG: L,D-transpeptidase [Actinobacteria bacterium]|nr:L,D-transpeptidase [Actinomycetota bacterium]
MEFRFPAIRPVLTVTAIVALAFAGATIAAPAKPPPVAGIYDRAGGATAFAPNRTGSWSARVIIRTRSRLGPSQLSAPGPWVSTEAPYARGDQVLLVQDAQRDARGTVWYRLLLTSRPNDRTAWLPADALALRRNPWRVRVFIGQRRAQLLRAGRVQKTWRVVVGRPIYPTPVGRFAISEIVPQDLPGGFFGPFIVTLTAHSNKLNDFAGGDGRVALHGTSRPSLLGTAASHGCVRFSNRAITTIARLAPPGTPVDVLA